MAFLESDIDGKLFPSELLTRIHDAQKIAFDEGFGRLQTHGALMFDHIAYKQSLKQARLDEINKWNEEHPDS